MCFKIQGTRIKKQVNCSGKFRYKCVKKMCDVTNEVKFEHDEREEKEEEINREKEELLGKGSVRVIINEDNGLKENRKQKDGDKTEQKVKEIMKVGSEENKRKQEAGEGENEQELLERGRPEGECRNKNTRENEDQTIEENGPRRILKGDTQQNKISPQKDEEASEEDDNEDRTRWKIRGRGRVAMMTLLSSILANVTVEPLLIMQTLADNAEKMVQDKLVMEKCCLVTLEKPPDVCSNLTNYYQDNIEVQKAASTLSGWISLSENIVAPLLLLYLGPLSDRLGRKPLLVLSEVGGLLKVVCYLVNASFMSWPASLLLVGPAVGSLGGGYHSFMMLLYCIIGDVTTTKNRTFRIFVLRLCRSYSGPLADLIFGQVYRVWGSVGCLWASVGLWAVCLVYTLLLVAETAGRGKEKGHREGEGEGEGGWKLVWRLPTSAVRVAVKSRKGYHRATILTTLTIAACVALGNVSKTYMFTQLIFGWDPATHSLWSLYTSLLSATANLVSLPVMVKYLRWPDVAVGMVASASKGLKEIMYGQVLTEAQLWIMFVAPLVGLLEANSSIADRAILSKCVDADTELGKIYSAMAIIEAGVIMARGPIYAIIYTKTIDTWPAFQYVYIAALEVVMVYLFWLDDILLRRTERATER